MKRILALVVLLLASGGASPAPPAAYKVIPVENGGWITGRIVYTGPRAERKEIMPTVDAPVCGQHGMIPSDELVVSSGGGLQYAVVRITNIMAGRPASDIPPTLFLQKGCMFSPHVFAVAVGTTVKERNTDGILHNVHTHSSRNPSVNFAHTPAVPEMPLTSFSAPESVKITCDVHAWMSAWIWVSPHPYIAVTAADGTYKISGVPPGQYRLEVWHEALGKVSHEVAVAPGRETRLDLSLPVRSTASGASGSMGSMEEKHGTMKSETPKATAHEAHVAKKPVAKVDINSASKEDLMNLGLPEDTAEKIVEGRPYKTKGELLTKKMLTSAQYRKIRARVIAKQGAAAATK